jgi:hypothetical protein
VAGDPLDLVLRDAARQGWHPAPSPGRDGVLDLAREGASLYVTVDADWVSFVAPARPPGEAGEEAWRVLLQQCRRFYLCKYALDGGGRLLLQLELPRPGLQWGDCARAVEAITRAVDGRLGATTGQRGDDLPAEGEEEEVFSQAQLGPAHR